jgi:hypothetical protein
LIDFWLFYNFWHWFDAKRHDHRNKCLNHFCEKAKTRFEKPLWRIICIMQWIFLGDLTHTYVHSFQHSKQKKIVKSNFGFVLWAGHLSCCKEKWKNKHFCFAQNSCMILGGYGGLKVDPSTWKILKIDPPYPQDFHILFKTFEPPTQSLT